MRALRTSTLVAVLLAATAGTALAADYPYSGYFVANFDDLPMADVQLICANGFFRQDRDGTYVSYHLDPDRYKTDGTVRYVRYGAGTCTLDPVSKVEACRMTMSTDPTMIGEIYYDVIQSAAGDVIDAMTFDSAGEALAWTTTGSPEPNGNMRLTRCAGFDDASMKDALTDGVSTLDGDALGALIAPELDDQSREAMAAVREKLLSGH